MDVRGINLDTGLPYTVKIGAAEIRESLMPTIMRLVDAVKNTLAITPPEMASDIMDRGIVLTGGGALLKGLDELLYQEVEVPVHIANDPLSCVVVGTERVLTDPAYKKILDSTEYDGRY